MPPMNSYPIPINERERLDELHRLDILDTPPDEFFDRLTRLAAKACDSPIALISLIDGDRQWFKSRVGLDAQQTPREEAFCAHTILGTEPLVVEDAATDPRFAANALVLSDPHIRFYAAAPLITTRGFAIGSLCVIDRRPRTLGADQIMTLRLLAVQVVQQLELRLAAENLRRQSQLLEKVQQTGQVGGWEIDLRTNVLTWTEETYRIHGVTRREYRPEVDTAIGFYTPETAPQIRQAVEAASAGNARFDLEAQIVRKDGVCRWVRAIGRFEAEAGGPGRVVGVIQDITERRLLENEIVMIAQREQTRIGLDLHDGLGQELTGISLMLCALLRKVPDAAVEFRDELTRVEGLLRDAIGTCRALAHGLSPTDRERGGLIGAVRMLAQRVQTMSGVAIRLRTRGPEMLLDDTVADHLFRIIQEAISNAIKHGPASRIDVSIDFNAVRTLISVADDGRGGAAIGAEGMGLGIMRYRARLIGAAFSIEATAAGGTRVRCRRINPLREAAAHRTGRA